MPLCFPPITESKLTHHGLRGPLSCMFQMFLCSNSTDLTDFYIINAEKINHQLNQVCWRKTARTCRMVALKHQVKPHLQAKDAPTLLSVFYCLVFLEKRENMIQMVEFVKFKNQYNVGVFT
uniref:Uncharacterized protein n=1 Tax=Nothobranchius furzeri TaxID=105023 RepID=A0A1A8UWU9_NOTFU